MWRDGEELARGMAARHSRGGFLSRVAVPIITWIAGPLAGASSLGPASTRYYGFCGHTFTTNPCPHPFPKLPRIDRHGYPLRPSDGHRVDNLGRPVDASGYVVDSAGNRRVGPTGEPVARAPRSRPCQDWVPHIYGFHTRFDGAWYRCCSGQIRKLVDCCAYHNRRINGDAALVGYCFHGRKVFCVLYYDTQVPC